MVKLKIMITQYQKLGIILKDKKIEKKKDFDFFYFHQTHIQKI